MIKKYKTPNFHPCLEHRFLLLLLLLLSKKFVKITQEINYMTKQLDSKLICSQDAMLNYLKFFANVTIFIYLFIYFF